MTSYCYPVCSDTKSLPVCVCGVGVMELEKPLNRENGYPYHQLLICLEGGGKIAAMQKRHSIRVGDMLFIPAGLAHEIQPGDIMWKSIGVDLDGSCIDSLFETLKLTKLRCERLSDHEVLARKMLAMIHCVREDNSWAVSESSALAYDLLMQLHKQINITSSAPDGQKFAQIAPVIEYMRQNSHQEMALDDLAAMIGLSPQYLCRLFKDCYRMRPFEYLAKVRIGQAKIMLAQEKYTVNEIAQIVGYNDCSYFCSVFKKHEGISPAEFRALNCPDSK
ncbi:MAG: helix-turn-helix transcriptional regulator [Ruminococcus sp.]|nr:helix-turn-helix transcriptional regulator [Ruminococcus sp.]